MYTYKIKEENTNDSLQTVVVKEGITAEFKLQDVYNHKLKLEQDIKEKEGQVEISKASMLNIEKNHKDVKKIVDQIKKMENSQGILATLYLYVKHDIDRETNEKMVQERKDLVKEYEDELKVIHETLNLPEPVKITYDKAK